MGKTGSDLVTFLKSGLNYKTYGKVLRYVGGTENKCTINLSRKYKHLDCDSMKFLKDWRKFKDRNLPVKLEHEIFNYSAAKQAMIAALRQSVYLDCSLINSQKIYTFLTEEEVKEKKKLKKIREKKRKEVEYLNPSSVESGYISSKEEPSPLSEIGSPSYVESEPGKALFNINHDHNFYGIFTGSPAVDEKQFTTLTPEERLLLPEETLISSMENIYKGDMSNLDVNPVLGTSCSEDTDFQNSEIPLDLNSIDWSQIDWDSLDWEFLEKYVTSGNPPELPMDDLSQHEQDSSEMRADFSDSQENSIFQEALAAYQSDSTQLQGSLMGLNQEYSTYPTEVSYDFNGPSQKASRKSKMYKFLNMSPMGEQVLFICEGEEIEVEDTENVGIVAFFDEDLHKRLMNKKIERYVEVDNHLLLILQNQNQCVVNG